MVIDQRKRKRFISMLLLILVCIIVASCSLFTTPSTTNKPSSQQADATALGVAAPVCRLVVCTNFNPIAGTRRYPDTWDNIHLFQTFDFSLTDPATVAKKYDFIWGASPQKVALYRRYNPNILLSYYMTLNHDDGAFGNLELGNTRGVDYWKGPGGHPDWLLYKCDRKTPSYVKYENLEPNAPFMLDNPDIVQWQVDTFARPASEAGYDALAVDHFTFENLFGACGHYDKNGQWVQRYAGTVNDPAWQADLLLWATRMQDALHKLPHPLMLIVNMSNGGVPLNTDVAQNTLAHVDGVLDEMGFAHYGDYYLSGDDWLQKMHLVDTLQRQNKPFFSINEFHNQITRDDMKWALGSYLMCKGHLSMFYLAVFGSYGKNDYYKEYDLAVGSPTSEMYMAQNVYWRDYTHARVLVNPGNKPATIQLDTTTSYTDIDGGAVSASFTMPAHSAQVLLMASH